MVFTDDDIADAQRCPTLGPAYFSAQRFVAEAMHGTDALDFADLLKEHADAVYRKLQDAVQDHLWSDTETNLQHQMWRTVDETVKALLEGNRWALERYALGDRYDAVQVRKAIAEHIPDEIARARIADLEEELRQTKEALQREVRR